MAGTRPARRARLRSSRRRCPSTSSSRWAEAAQTSGRAVAAAAPPVARPRRRSRMSTPADAEPTRYAAAITAALPRLEDDDASSSSGGRRRRRRHLHSRRAPRAVRAGASSTRRSASWASSASAVGAADGGLRPIVDIMFMDFLGVCLDQIVNQAAKMKYMFGGALGCRSSPTRRRGPRAGAQHSQSLEAWFAHIPGLKVVLPATVTDAYDMLREAVARSRPGGLGREQATLRGERPVAEDPLPLGKARIAARATRSPSSRGGRWCTMPRRRGARDDSSRSSTCGRCSRSTWRP